MSILDKKGISVTSGFKLVSGQPLDARNVVDDLTGLQDLINNGAAYEGIVVYVKSEQQLKQYNGSEWNNVYPESDIITVDSLPNIANAELDKIYRVPKLLITSGTALPNTGTVENIHFNKSLSITEVEDILNELTFTDEAYLALAASDESPIIVVYKHTDPEGMVIRSESGRGVLWANEGAVQNYASTYGITTAGWQDFDNPKVLNEEVKATAGGADVGTQNGLLTGMIFTDPFSETIVGYNYYRVVDGEWAEVLTEVNELIEDFPTRTEVNELIDDFLTRTEVNELIDDFLTRTEVNELIDDFTTRTEVNELIEDFTTRTEVDELIEDFTTRTEVNTLITNKTTSTIDESTNLPTSNAVKTYVDEQVANAGSGSGNIEDVEELPEVANADLTKVYRVPEYDWVGTEVPSSGTIEKVYINTQLNNTEVLEILQSVDLINVSGYSYPLYAIVCTADFSSGLTIMNNTSSNVYYLTLTASGTQTRIWQSDTGWVNASDSLTIGYENALSVVTSQLGATVQNDKLKNLISATAFTGNLIGYKYYRVIDGEWVEVINKGATIITKNLESIQNTTATFTEEERNIITTSDNVILKLVGDGATLYLPKVGFAGDSMISMWVFYALDSGKAYQVGFASYQGQFSYSYTTQTLMLEPYLYELYADGTRLVLNENDGTTGTSSVDLPPVIDTYVTSKTDTFKRVIKEIIAEYLAENNTE